MPTKQMEAGRTSRIVILVLVGGLALLLGCGLVLFSLGILAEGNALPAEVAGTAFGVTRTANAVAYATDLVAAKTAIAEANATELAARQTAVAMEQTKAAMAQATEMVVVRTAAAQSTGSVIVVVVATSTPAGDYGPTSTPLGETASPTPESTPTPAAGEASPGEAVTPEPGYEAAADSELTEEDTLGELKVEYPVHMSPGSSDSVVVSIYIPPKLASQTWQSVERIDLPPELPPVLSAAKTHFRTIPVRSQMRVELFSPTFKVDSMTSALQAVNLQSNTEVTYWVWTIVASPTPGVHILTLKVYRGEETTPVWLGSLKVLIEDFTPTPGPTSTWTPVVTPTLPPTATPTPAPTPFLQTPLGTTLVGGGFTLVVALIGLLGAYLGRERLPYINTQASQRRRLNRLQGNLAYLKEQAAQYGSLEVPVKLHNDIAATEAEIEQLKQELGS